MTRAARAPLRDLDAKLSVVRDGLRDQVGIFHDGIRLFLGAGPVGSARHFCERVFRRGLEKNFPRLLVPENLPVVAPKLPQPSEREKTRTILSPFHFPFFSPGRAPAGVPRPPAFKPKTPRKTDTAATFRISGKGVFWPCRLLFRGRPGNLKRNSSLFGKPAPSGRTLS